MVDLSGGPPSSRGRGGDKDRIGIPDDYDQRALRERFRSKEFPKGRYYRARSGRVTAVRSRYLEGDEWKLLAGRSPEDIYDIQARLVRTGVLSAKSFQPGIADTATRKAFVDILAEANQNGMRWGDWLDGRVELADATGFTPSTGRTRAPLSITLTNPDDIKADLGAQSTNLLGSQLDDPDKIVQEVHAQETAYQTAAYNADETGATVTKPPDLQASLIAKHPDAYAVNRLGQNAQSFINLMRTTEPGMS